MARSVSKRSIIAEFVSELVSTVLTSSLDACDNSRLSTYKRHRFHPSIISYAIWVYYRFNLSFRDIEDLLAEKGISVSYEAIRLWCIKFGPAYARKLKHKRTGFGDTFYLDEVFIKIN